MADITDYNPYGFLPQLTHIKIIINILVNFYMLQTRDNLNVICETG